jgi:hypothetical protein
LYDLVADGTPCTDGDACTQGDICESGSCTPGVPATCQALDQCHVAGTCDSATGACSNPVSTDPSCAGAPPPTVVPQPQGLPGMVPSEIAGLDPTNGMLTVTGTPNLGGSNPSPPQTQAIPALIGSVIECLADFNADGATDVVFANQAAGALQFVPRLASQVVAYDTTPVTIDAAMPAGAPGPAACGDVDGDGQMDIVVSFATPDGSGATTPTLMLYRSLGSGNGFQRISIPHGFPSGVVTGGLGLADFDGDGRPDLAVYAANNQLLDSQIFVFPNQGIAALAFSQSSRISLPATDAMAGSSLPIWGALTIRDWDGDGQPDIWAIGNRGTVNLFRSLGGFQFAAPEIGGVVQVPSARFSMDSFDANADGIPDLLLAGLDVGATAQLFASAGGGVLSAFIAPSIIFGPQKGQPTSGTNVNHQLTWKIVNSPTPPPDAGVGLVKGSPLVTYYYDSRGVQMPSIIAQAVNGHLLERVGQNQSSTTVVPTSGPIQVQGLDGATITVTDSRVQTDSVTYTWIDHGVPAVSGPGVTAHQTIVGSQPAVAFEQAGSSVLRRIYVRGVDGHLWELDQQNGTEQWVDDGLPTPPTPVGQTDPTGGAIVPLVGAPSAVAGSISAANRTFVYILDAAGRLDSFHIPVDEGAWLTAGPIGSNNCFGTPGTVGDGSPKAISYVTITFTTLIIPDSGVFQVPHVNLHTEVFVVGAMGDLFSWQDGRWEEILDAQYGVKFQSVVPNAHQGFNPRNFTAVPVCPNGPAPNPPLPEEQVYKPGYNRPYALRGTPDVAVWAQTLCVTSGGGCFTNLTREVVVRGDGGTGNLYAFDIIGAATNVASLTTPAKLDLSSVSPAQVGFSFNPYVAITQQPTGVLTLQPPYCALAGEVPVQDQIISDPNVVMDLDGSVTVLATSIEHHLTMYHRSPVSVIFFPSTTQSQWEKHPIPPPQVLPKNDGYSSGVIGVVGAIPGVHPTQAGAMGSRNVPSLDIFAIRSDGILAEANSAADANGNWQSAEPDTQCKYFGDFSNGGTFQWLTDAAHDHTPANAPAILDHLAGANDNPSSPGSTNGSQCFQNSVATSIFPQWTSVQRQNATYHDLEFGANPSPPFNQGFNDDVMVEIEGTVIDSHIAAIDNIINHTHGEDNRDIPRVHHDWNIILAPDVQYQKLLTDANMLEGGVMELEWEMADHLECTETAFGFCVKYGLVQPSDSTLLAPQDRAAFTADVIPAVGDRIAARGRFIFDCGHPPFRSEIHPIDALAVIHHSDYANVRFSNNGGYTWYQPGDDNIKVDERCEIDDRFKDLASTLLDKPNVTGWGPLDDLVADVKWAQKIIGLAEFADGGCERFFDTELVSPTAIGKDGINSKTCYTHYAHPMNDMFPNDATTPLPYVPISFPANNPFQFTVPGGPQILPEFNAQAGATTQVYNSGATVKSIGVCFERHPQGPGHDTQDPGLINLEGCSTDTRQELVTWISANGQSRLYADGGDNCLAVNLYPDDTLAISSHGFECDFSCGEHWDDDFTAAADDRIGFTRASFTADQNWGLPGGTTSTGQTLSGTYTLTSQPDLATINSRQKSAGDYTMTVTIVPPIAIADQQAGSP